MRNFVLYAVANSNFSGLIFDCDQIARRIVRGNVCFWGNFDYAGFRENLGLLIDLVY